MILRIILNIL
jgi:chromosome segregation ATPase